jgi:hypothetical protein
MIFSIELAWVKGRGGSSSPLHHNGAVEINHVLHCKTNIQINQND